MRERGNTYRVLVGNPEGKNRLQNLDVDETIMLKWSLKHIGEGR
jgi:hypothetical protein